jgi:hypothetical protein
MQWQLYEPGGEVLRAQNMRLVLFHFCTVKKSQKEAKKRT